MPADGSPDQALCDRYLPTGRFGRLPGDLRFGGENGRVFVPITSMLLLSIGVSALLNLAFWFFRR